MEETVSVASYLSPDSSRNEQCTLRILAQKGSPRRPPTPGRPEGVQVALWQGRGGCRAFALGRAPHGGRAAGRVRPWSPRLSREGKGLRQEGRREDPTAETRPSREFQPQLLVLTSLAPAADPVLDVSPSRTSAVIGVQASPLTSRSGWHFGVRPSSVRVASPRTLRAPHPGCAAEPGPDAPPCFLAVRCWSACSVWARLASGSARRLPAARWKSQTFVLAQRVLSLSTPC